MQLRKNAFKAALHAGRSQYGLWLGLADAYAAELLATAGFDWLLIDGEHAPNDLRTVLAQLQAVGRHPAIVRVNGQDPAMIKQYLDIGAQTLLVPMVDTAEQAERVVAATRYPPQGIRGVGSALARASLWNKVDDYLQDCAQELCVIVQAESVSALTHLEAIAAVDGVDGVFFGPSDLAADMGLLGQPNSVRVKEAIGQGIEVIVRSGKRAGVLATDPAAARFYLDHGATFVGVGVDTSLLVQAASALAAQYGAIAGTDAGAANQGY